MSFVSHLRSWLKTFSRVSGSRTRPVRNRPRIEELEDRTLPSTTSLTPIFNADFNQPTGSLPSTSTWTYNTGTDPNNTAVHYVDDSTTLSVVNDPSASDGKALAMTIYPTSANDQTFNSARINTAGDPAANVEYGLIEARIKLPGGPNGQGDGLWPAFWMLGSDHQQGVGWPNCGEIDVMEQGLGGPSIINGSTHFGNISGPTREDTTATYTLPGGQDFYSSYHTFAVYWTPGVITFSVDGTPYASVARSSYSAALWNQTFDQPYYLILNINDGGPNNSGGFGGPVTSSSTFPQTMDVDYVRAYSLTSVTTPTNLTAIASAANTVNLSWQDSANDDTGFVLQRSTTADFSTLDATFNLAQGTTSYQDTTAAPGTTYYYRLQAVATDGIHNYASSYANATVTTTGVVSPVITSGAAPTTATVGSVCTYQFTATGSPTPILSASGLPSWLTFTASTGVLSGTPTAATAGSSATITLTANNGVSPNASLAFTIHVVAPATPANPIGNTLYLLRATTSGSGGTLSAQAGSGAEVDTVSSAGGINHDGTPTNPLVFVIPGLTGTWDPAAQTRFTLFVDAGTNLANGTQLRISYDFNGDGVYDRVETYHYFAEDNRVGWETYTQAAGLESATGSFANFVNGSIKVEIWNAIGLAPVSLRTDASASEGQQSMIQVPFTMVGTPGAAGADLALNRPVVASSVQNNSYPAANAVDGNSATRWSSQFSDTQWIQVDLGATYNITEVSLNWETAAGKDYLIQVSADAVNWTTIATITDNTTAGIHDYTGLSGMGRYVRIYCTARDTAYGYSLYDFDVYGTAAVGTTPLSRSSWTVTASSTEAGGNPENALDGNLATRWSSGKPMTGGEWLQIDLGSIQTFDRIVLNSGSSVNDYARGYQVLISTNGTDWTTLAVGTGGSALIDVSSASPVSARYVRIVQTGTSSYWWSIAELNLYL